jgi:hypothetical protein
MIYYEDTYREIKKFYSAKMKRYWEGYKFKIFYTDKIKIIVFFE